ncbi:MAG TPA: fasciclin domain-containing protein [Leptolyngbyaceae cyanobacterium M33_DOE_097]|nr:fasciclin domain-containing protein [Leptolyngbyaceae cyanobacterium M33_DOE_097]
MTSLVAASSFIFGAGLTAIAESTSSQVQTDAASDRRAPTSVAPSEFVPEGAQDVPVQPQLTPTAETNRADSLSQESGDVDQRTTAPTRNNTVKDPNRTDLPNNTPSTRQTTPGVRESSDNQPNNLDTTAPRQDSVDSTPTDPTGPDGVNNDLNNTSPNRNQNTSPNRRDLNNPRQGADAAPNAAPGGSTQYPTPAGRIPAPINNVDGNSVTPQQQQNQVPGSMDGTTAPRQEPSDVMQPENQQPQAPDDRNSSSMMDGMTTAMGNRNLEEAIRESPSFELFNALLRVADDNGALSAKLSSGNYTVLAPTDQVLAALPPGAIKQLVQPENRQLLKEIISNHILEGNVPADAVSGVSVVQPGIQVSNGMIHAVDRILLPSNNSLSLSGPGGTLIR